MRKAMGYVAALALLVAGLFSPAWLLWSGEPAAVPGEDSAVTVADLDATFTLDDEGVLSVVERLTVDVPDGATRDGIVRVWDRADASDERVRRRVENVDVSLDGDVAPYELRSAEHGRLDVAEIGGPDEPLEPGRHVVVISYRVVDVIGPGYDGAPSSFYRELVAAEWQYPVARARLTVRLPGPPRGVQCGIGLDAPRAACETLRVRDATTITIRTGPLPEHTPVALRVGLDLAEPEVTHLPWAPRYDVVLGQSRLLLGVVLGVSVLAALLGWLAVRRAREQAPPFRLSSEPPDGVGPAQAAYVLSGTTDRAHYVASLLHAARLGAVDLTRHGGAWTVTHRDRPEAWSGLDPVTAGGARLAGGPGTSFTIEPDDATTGERIRAELVALDTATREWARASGHVETVRRPGLGGVVVLLLLLAAGAAAIWNPLDMAIIGLVPGSFAVAALPLLRPGAATRRTSAGRNLWSRAGGFERALSTPGGVDLSGHEDRYAAYLPWAVAFGCTDAWAAAYRAETGCEPPTPSYVGGRHAAEGSSGAGATIAGDLEAALTAPVEAVLPGRPAPPRPHPRRGRPRPR